MQERDFEGHIWVSQESSSKRKSEASNEQNGCFSPKIIDLVFYVYVSHPFGPEKDVTLPSHALQHLA